MSAQRPAAPARPGRALALLVTATLLIALAPATAPIAASPPAPTTSPVRLPLLFTPAAPQAGLVARGPGGALLLGPSALRLTLPAPAGPRGLDVGVRLVGARAGAHAVGEDPVGARVSAYLGADPSAWQADLPAFAGAVYGGLYPGVDLHVRGDPPRAVFAVAPGADPAQIRWAYEGAAAAVDPASGALRLAASPGAPVTAAPPVAYQTLGERRAPVAVAYAAAGDAVGLAVGPYDPARPLLLELPGPFGGIVGGDADDALLAVKVVGDAIYVAGETRSAQLPGATNGHGGALDAFVARLSLGGELVYTTYVGGVADDYARELDVGPDGATLIGGTTFSADFPLIRPFQDARRGGADAFVAALDSAGHLAYSSYLGGDGVDYGKGVAFGADGSIYAAGTTSSPATFPTVSPIPTPYSGSFEIFAARLSPGGATMAFGTVLGSTSADALGGMAVDAAGMIYLAGATSSGTFPTLSPARPFAGGSDAFVVKLDPFRSALIYGTFLGGAGDDQGLDIAVDREGHAYVAGRTWSADFPVVGGLRGAGGGRDGFVAKLSARGNLIVYSTHLGGAGDDEANAVATDGAFTYVAGTTASADFPVGEGAAPGGGDAFTARLGGAGALEGASYLGGSGSDRGNAIALWTYGAVVAGETSSADFPGAPTAAPGGGNGFVAMIGRTTETVPIAGISSITPGAVERGAQLAYFRGTGRLTGLVRGPYITSYEWSSSIDGVLSGRKEFALPADRLSAGLHTIALRVRDAQGKWSAPAIDTLRVDEGPSSVRALIITSGRRLEELYGLARAGAVLAALRDLALAPAAPGIVVQLEADPAAAAAYAAWAAAPADTARANAVADAIHAIVMDRWAANPDLEYLVIAGDDRVVPFRRVANRYDGSSQQSYALSQGLAGTTTGDALVDGQVLTDDFYSDRAPSLPNPADPSQVVYVPDLGTGRLIETPEEIVGQVASFLGRQRVPVGSAAYTAYEQLTGSAQPSCAALQGDGIATDCTLSDDSWGRPEFLARVLGQRHDLVSLNQHAWHGGYGVPVTTTGGIAASDFAQAPADLSQTLYVTVGCFAGLNVPPEAPSALDLAQAAAQRRANWLGHTGLGYIYTSPLLLNELTRLMVFGGSAAVGPALRGAKEEFVLTQGAPLSGLEQKVLMETVLYGLPMYTYATPNLQPALAGAEAAGAPPAVAVSTGDPPAPAAAGLSRAVLSYSFPRYRLVAGAGGEYFTLDEPPHLEHGAPVQPRLTADLSSPDSVARGVVFLGGTYTTTTGFDVAVTHDGNEYVALPAPELSAERWYPALPAAVSGAGGRVYLVAQAGQYSPRARSERLFSAMSLAVYYHPGGGDLRPPEITGLRSASAAGGTDVRVWAADGSGVAAVVVAYTDGSGRWASAELSPAGDGWAGRLPLAAGGVFFIQAVDAAGNVSALDNGGRYFTAGAAMQQVALPLLRRGP